MITKKLNEKKLIQVKDVGGCTNFGGLDLVGSKMYTVKTKSTNKLSYISVYKNYKKTTRTNHKFVNCMGHANGMAYASGHLYIAPCDKYVEVVSTSTWKHERIYCDVTACSIAHVAGNQFVIGYGGKDKYNLCLAEPSGNKMVIKKRWQVRNPKYASGYSITQDIGYNKQNGCVYLILTKNNYRTNVILMAKLYSTEPDICYTSKTSASGKYEIETIGFLSSGKAVVGMNLPSGKDSTFSAM